MIKRNSCLENLKAGYLFPEIARRKNAFLAEHPDASLISLGIGNTTEPLFPKITEGLSSGAQKLGTREGYSGYGDEQGLTALRKKIADVFYKGAIKTEEVFVSDGAKCDIGRIQLLFGSKVSVAVQDPSYPVYVDGSILIGAGGAWQSDSYKGLVYLPCTAENGFFPDLTKIPHDSLIYFCSPNNPTGAVATRAQLQKLVDVALKIGSIIIFDAAYSEFIRDTELPKTIYEIEGAHRCAIEINSFSKPAGFTGVRLGWSIVPLELSYAGGESVNADWNRVCTTIFNGASNIAQQGALAALSPDGQKEMRKMTDFYLENARLIRETLLSLGVTCVGGDNSPYIWAHFPGKSSWDIFETILEKCQIVTTPGAGFGPAGDSFIRFSAFGHRADIEEACRRLQEKASFLAL